MESYNKENTLFSGIKAFSAGLNNQPVKNFLINVNNCNIRVIF